ncbi:ComF family protein [Kitasatospora sp. NBC_00374]|uniref:ComF family protein n=1 Tax=Kitasatospora sp. NBC_00374 TaxID=2975964 RepID=UPI0032444025
MTALSIPATHRLGLLDLLLPAVCVGCRGGPGQLCPECRRLLAAARPGPAGPRPAPPGLPPLHAAGPYAEPLRSLLIAHKERGALRLAGPLGALLAGAVRSAAGDTGPVLLVPVPSTRRSVRARGHDPMLRLARSAARALRRSGRYARVAPVLRQTRRVADQAGLDADGRRRNLAGALAVPARSAARLGGAGQRHRLVLVDDLVTTGASLAEAARALAAAGLAPYAAATVAAVARRPAAPGAGPRRARPQEGRPEQRGPGRGARGQPG